MKNNNIYILSQAIGTGKSTHLINWYKNKKSVTGFITPIQKELRVIQNIATGNIYTFEITQPNNTEALSIGRYLFSKKGFDQGKKILQNAFKNPSEWVIIDELGKLEMKNQGFEPELGVFISQIQNNKNTKLILVIRDTLLQAAIKKYQLQEATVINIEQLQKLK